MGIYRWITILYVTVAKAAVRGIQPIGLLS